VATPGRQKQKTEFQTGCKNGWVQTAASGDNLQGSNEELRQVRNIRIASVPAYAAGTFVLGHACVG
jgi:hypothetical protein